MKKFLLLIPFSLIFITSCLDTNDRFEIVERKNSIFKLDKKNGDTWLYDRGEKNFVLIEINQSSDDFTVPDNFYWEKEAIKIAKRNFYESNTDFLLDKVADGNTRWVEEGWHAKFLDGDTYIVKHGYTSIDTAGKSNSRAWVYEVHLNSGNVSNILTDNEKLWTTDQLWYNYTYSEPIIAD